MSTLGTFAKYSGGADFARGKKKVDTPSYAVIKSNPVSGMVEMPAAKPTPRVIPIEDDNIKALSKPSPKQPVANMPYKSKRRVTKGKQAEKGFEKLGKLKTLKNRNLAIGAGLGLAGLGTAGAIAYNNRNANMSAQSAFANFVSKDKKDAVKAMTQTGNADADAAIKLVRDESRKARRKELTNLKTQKGFESAADRGDAYKNAKGGEYISRTLATAGSPERALIRQGKNSKNEFIKSVATNAEKIGSAGYKQGATGLRKAGNAIAGRTLTGKAVRLGAAGLGLSAIGGAMKRNRQERG